MTGESFASRVRGLRREWIERRQIRQLTAAHDFDSQFRLLLTLHKWARQAVVEILTEYQGRIRVVITPAPEPTDEIHAFSVIIEDVYTLHVVIAERPSPGGPRWRLSASIGTPLGVDAVSPRRAVSHWTRARLEELLLSVLGAYERSLSEDSPELSLSRTRRSRTAARDVHPGDSRHDDPPGSHPVSSG